MFSVVLFLAVLSHCSVCSQINSTNGYYIQRFQMILNSLNVTELNVTTLNQLLTKLNLKNCSALKTGSTEDAACGQRCLTAEHLFATHGFGKRKNLTPSEFVQLSTSLLIFLLPEKNAGQFAVEKFCQNGGQNNGSAYEGFLQYYQTNGLICARFVDRILRDLKNEFGDSVIKRKCFSAADLFDEMELSPEQHELDRKQFSEISTLIISHLLHGDCVNVKDDQQLKLPCRSYFVSKLLEHFGAVDGYVSLEGFKNILKSIGLGNDSHLDDDHDDADEDDSHIHRRKKREVTQHGVNISGSKQCYSADELAEIFTVNKSVGIDGNAFSEISPALIQQLESRSCIKVKHEEEKENADSSSDDYVWLYGFVSVLIISLLSLAGIAVIPTMRGHMYKKIIIVLVGLAIGTLTGDALFHLIPHAAGFHADSHGSHGHDSGRGDEGKAFLWKFLVVASGVYGFFLFETFTHLFLRSGGHGHSHNNIEHTRKHSPFERNNSCRTVERHEMRLVASTPLSDAPADSSQVIFNQVSGKTEGKISKPKSDCCNHEDNIPNLLTDSSHGPEKKISSVGWMIIIGDTIHNITDGIAIGAAFTQDIGGGLSTSIAVFCHELPHELGDFAVLISSGMTVKQAMLANFLSACSSFIGLVIGILIGQKTEDGNQWIFAVMGGMFLYIALVDMLPELMHSEELGGAGRLQIFLLQNIGILLGFILMLLIAYFEEDLVISW